MGRIMAGQDRPAHFCPILGEVWPENEGQSDFTIVLTSIEDACRRESKRTR